MRSEGFTKWTANARWRFHNVNSKCQVTVLQCEFVWLLLCQMLSECKVKAPEAQCEFVWLLWGQMLSEHCVNLHDCCGVTHSLNTVWNCMIVVVSDTHQMQREFAWFLWCQTLTEGLLVLGRVKEVQDFKVMVSLPNGLLATLPITAVSDTYTQRLQSVADSSSDDIDVSVHCRF